MKKLILLSILLVVGCEEATKPLEEDCAEVAGGTAELDNCNVCDSDSSNDNTTCTQDCAGVWGGTAIEDCAGECGGSATFGYYYADVDGDGLGSGGDTWLCSSNTNGYALDNTDWNDDCHCPENTDAACFDCLGNCKNMDNGSMNPDYIGDDTGLTNVCTSDENLGCDECDVCNGPGKNYICDGSGWHVCDETECPEPYTCSCDNWYQQSVCSTGPGDGYNACGPNKNAICIENYPNCSECYCE